MEEINRSRFDVPKGKCYRILNSPLTEAFDKFLPFLFIEARAQSPSLCPIESCPPQKVIEPNADFGD